MPIISVCMINNKYIKNSIWLVSEKLIVLLGGFLITTLVARYIGVEAMGKLSLGITLSALCIIVSQWGANFTIFNDSVSKPKESLNTIYSTFKLRVSLYIISWFIVSLCLYCFLETIDAIFVSLVCLSNIFLALDVYQFYFNGTLESKVNTKSTLFGKVFSILFRTLVVVFGLSVWLIVLSLFLEGLIILQSKRKEAAKFSVDDSFIGTRNYLKKGLPFLVSGVMVFTYSKINEIYIQKFMSFHELGIYSTMLLLSSVWLFLPLSIGTSYLTRSIETKNKNDLAAVYFIVILVSLPVILLFHFFGSIFISFTFGLSYASGAELLPIMTITSMLSTLSFLTNRYIGSFKNGSRYVLYKSIIMAVVSLVFTWIMIDYFGLYGAVISILFLEVSNSTFGNYFFNKGEIFRAHVKIFSIRKNIELLLDKKAA
ncbi:oligosaccharide flippase family protein [Vibrio breoganii]